MERFMKEDEYDDDEEDGNEDKNDDINDMSSIEYHLLLTCIIEQCIGPLKIPQGSNDYTEIPGENYDDDEEEDKKEKKDDTKKEKKEGKGKR